MAKTSSVNRNLKRERMTARDKGKRAELKAQVMDRAAPVEERSTLTPYVRWGDWFVGFCVLLLAGVNLPRLVPNAHVRRAGTAHNSGR